MVRRALSITWLLACCACGNVYDGSYEGDPRFVLNGSIRALSDPPAGFTGGVLVQVNWQLVPAPLPPPSSDGAATSGADAGSADPTSGSPANPNGASGAPTPPTTPTATSGSDGAVATVRFPAPLTLRLYDVPAVNKDPAALALGTMTVFYDIDGNGSFNAGDIVAGAAQGHRLIYSDGSLPPEDFASFGAGLDNAAALTRGYVLAQAQCANANALTVHVVANTTVDFDAGDIAPCE